MRYVVTINNPNRPVQGLVEDKGLEKMEEVEAERRTIPFWSKFNLNLKTFHNELSGYIIYFELIPGT